MQGILTLVSCLIRSLVPSAMDWCPDHWLITLALEPSESSSSEGDSEEKNGQIQIKSPGQILCSVLLLSSSRLCLRGEWNTPCQLQQGLRRGSCVSDSLHSFGQGAYSVGKNEFQEGELVNRVQPSPRGGSVRRCGLLSRSFTELCSLGPPAPSHQQAAWACREGQ